MPIRGDIQKRLENPQRYISLLFIGIKNTMKSDCVTRLLGKAADRLRMQHKV